MVRVSLVPVFIARRVSAAMLTRDIAMEILSVCGRPPVCRVPVLYLNIFYHYTFLSMR